MTYISTPIATGEFDLDWSGKYGDGSQAIQIFQDGEEWWTATVCVPNHTPPEGYVLIKNYSENAGLLPALIEAGIIDPSTERISSGFVSDIHLCKLTGKRS